MTTIDTSTAATATAYSNQRKIDRCQNGVLWIVHWNGTATTNASLEFWYSTDNGATWTEDAVGRLGFTSTTPSNVPAPAIFIDLDDYAHLAYKDRADGRIYYRRGTPNAGRTAWTWSATTQLENASWRHTPDLVAHRDGTGWKVHILTGRQQSNALATYYTRLGVTSGGVVSIDADTAIGGYAGGVDSTWPSIDFNHTGDGKTVAGVTPHLYAAWSTATTGGGEGIRFKKATYSAGAWTWGTEREIDSTRYIPSSDHWLNCLSDGTRVILAGMLYDGTNRDVVLYERDAADTTTTTRELIANTATSERLYLGSASYDGNEDVYLFGVNTDEAAGNYDLVYRKWTRATTTLGPEVVVDASVQDAFVSAKRGYSNNKIEFIYTDGTASPYSVTYESYPLNLAPTAATWDVTNNRAHDVAATLTLDWTFSDPDAGDTQGSYAMRRQIGAAAYDYWNAGTSSWGASEVQNTSSTTSLALSSSWGADGDANHKYAVKTWDAGGLEGSYSSELTVIPSAKDNPTISSPADAGTVTAPSVTVSWSATTQTAYRARLLSSASAELESSGWVTSTATSHAFSYTLANSTDYKVEVATKNDEGLASDADTNSFSVSFTPPATPTLAVAANATTGLMTVTVTNPGTGATEASNTVYVRVASGGRADIDRPVGGDGIRIATGVAVDGTFTDYAVASGVSYEYMVRAVADTGATADSAWT